MIKLLRFLKPYRSLLVLILLLAIANPRPICILPNLMSDIVNNGIAKFDTAYIRKTGAIMVLVAIGARCVPWSAPFSHLSRDQHVQNGTRGDFQKSSILLAP